MLPGKRLWDAGRTVSSQAPDPAQHPAISEGSAGRREAVAGGRGGDTLAARCPDATVSLLPPPVLLQHALIYQFGWV